MPHPSSVRLKRCLFAALMLLWVLPAVQAALNMKIFRPSLAGFEVKMPKPAFSWGTLADGSYPDSLEKYSSQKIGFREWLVRPHNQLLYSLFDKVSNPDIIIGKENTFFQYTTVQAYQGRGRLIPEAEVTEQVRLLRLVQDSLARRGKLLAFAIAPAKVSFAPELLPDSCRTGWEVPTNYDRYNLAMRAAGINLLDFRPVFRAWKAGSPYPLFPPGGTHWSGYGSTRAADTLWRFLEQRGHFRLPRVRQTGLQTSTTPRYTDNDITRLLNLLHAPSPPPLAYPVLAFDPPMAGQTKPRLLLIADSFGWSFIEFYPYLQNLFSPESHFWYYNHEVVWPKVNGQVPGPTQVAALDLRQQLANHDVVLLLFTEHNMVDFDRYFGKRAAEALVARP